MFDVTPDLLTILQSRSRDLIFVYEFYPYDYIPFPETNDFSYDPRHAVKLLAGQSVSFSWGVGTITYETQVLEGLTVNKHINKQFDTVSLKLSNVDRSTAAWILSNKIQGMRMVVRVIPKSANSLTFVESTHSPFAHSIILFVGRVNKPDGWNRSSGTISATQDLGTIESQIPPQQFQQKCPLVPVFKKPGFDCMGNEAMSAKTATYQAAKRCDGSFAQCTEYSNTKFFAGTRIVQIESSFVNKSHQGFFSKLGHIVTFGLLFGRKKTVVSNSVHDGQAYGQVIPIILGRWAKKLIALQYQDIGTSINFKHAAGRGKIKDFLNIRNEAVNFSAPFNVTEHLGEYGGTGTQTADTVFPDHSFHSRLAYITGSCTGSDIISEDPAPDISALIAGAEVRQAYGVNPAGVGRIDNSLAGYSQATDGWCDNPVDHARYIMNEPAILALPAEHFGEKASARTAAYCCGAIKDVSNAERALFPNTETTRAGVDYKRYYSTGVIGPRAFHGTGLDFLTPVQRPGGIPDREAVYEFFDPASLPTPASLGIKTIYRKRYTGNIEINEQKKAIDFLYDSLLTTFRGFLRWDSYGRVVIDCERPADHSYLRANASSGATTIKVLDVTPWKPLDAPAGEPSPTRGKLLIGVGKLTSEVRPISATAYTSDGNGITVTASATGGLSAVAGGASLAGGNSTTPASQTVTISGTPAVGDQITVTIDGYAITWIATQDDTVASIPNLTLAEQLVFAINAEPVLNNYIEAKRGAAPGSSTDVQIICKYGELSFGTALAENHFAEIANPTTAPTLGSSAGVLLAGTYQVAYAYRNANGNTLISNIASITIIANKQIDVTGISLPGGATSVDWFCSVEADSGVLTRVLNNNGSGFSINALPSVTELDVPKINTTGEETLRVLMSFAGKALAYADTTRANVLDGSFSWPEGSRQSTVNQVKTKYREAIQDFAEQPLVINDERHQEQTGQVNSVEIDLSAVDNFNQASRLCNGYLAKLRDADFFFKWGSAGEALLLEVGDVVCASDDSGAWRNVPIRIEDPTYNSKFEINFTGRLYSTSQFDDEVLQTDVPLPSALVNYKAGPPNISFNTVDFPPNGLTQSTSGSAGITSIRGGAIFGATVYGQYAKARLIKRGGVTVSEQIGILYPDSNLKAVFEFIASADGLYTVELEVCDLQNICNPTKPTASIVIGFGSLTLTPGVATVTALATFPALATFTIPAITVSVTAIAPSVRGVPPAIVSVTVIAPSVAGTTNILASQVLDWQFGETASDVGSNPDVLSIEVFG